jgi:hypothetical protein
MRSIATSCPLGSVLLPLLWSLAANNFSGGLLKDDYYGVGYADNISILIYGKFLHMLSEVFFFLVKK